MSNQNKRKAETETSENPESSRSTKREKIGKPGEGDDATEHKNICYVRAPTTHKYLQGCRLIFDHFFEQHSCEAVLADPSIVFIVSQRDMIKSIRGIPNAKALSKLFKEYDPHMRGYRFYHYTAIVTHLTNVEARWFYQRELLTTSQVDYNNIRQAFRILLKQIYTESLTSPTGQDIYGHKTTIPSSDDDDDAHYNKDDDDEENDEPPVKKRVPYLTPFDRATNNIDNTNNLRDGPTRIYNAYLAPSCRSWSTVPTVDTAWKQLCDVKFTVLPILPPKISTSSQSPAKPSVRSRSSKRTVKTRSMTQTTNIFNRVDDLVTQYNMGKTNATAYEYFSGILSFSDIQLLCNIVGKYFYNAQPGCLSHTFGKVLSDYIIALTQKLPSVDLTTEEEIPSDQTELHSDNTTLAMQIDDLSNQIDENIQKMTALINDYEAEIGAPIDISMIGLVKRSMRSIYHWMNKDEKEILGSGRLGFVDRPEVCRTPTKKSKRAVSTSSSSSRVTGSKTPGSIASATVSSSVVTKTSGETKTNNSIKSGGRKKDKSTKTAEVVDSTVKTTQPDSTNE